MRKVRFKLIKGVYSQAWILAVCVDGYPEWFAKYSRGEDALKALALTIDTAVFVGYPFEQFKDASFRSNTWNLKDRLGVGYAQLQPKDLN